ncbi:MAG TPA: YHS domain-containing (seleno)protein [Kiloniellaceae bacterium]|nr:YHS domain-containing (seleno)protein [Kiloniellaceae bacterium]
MLRFPLSRRRFGAAVLAGGLAAGLIGTGYFATRPAVALEPVFSEGGLAIHGYDPVAYFTEGKPVEGKAEFTHTHEGTEWRFATAANRDAFAADPARYAPQYGGYCAWAVSQGYTASTDPDAWHIEDGKLYLNYSRSVQRDWAKDIPGHIAKGDANWPGLKAGN